VPAGRLSARGPAGWFRPARISPPTRQGLLRGIMGYRWLTLGWAVAVFAGEVLRRNVGRDAPPVAHPVVGAVLLGLVVALNLRLTVLYRRDPDRLVTPAPVLTELFLMAGLLLADVWVYGTPAHAQSLPSVAVVAGILAAAMGAGLRPAVVAGFGLGLARYVGWLPYADDEGGLLSVGRLASWVLLVVAGWTAGYILRKLDAADRSIATYRAREEVARTLHDGVLQTLAAIQRRSDDAELVDLARNQELELREYLFGSATAEADDLAGALRATARRAEERHDLRVEVVCAPDLPVGDDRRNAAVCGAVGEALTNAVKHGRAERATVYAEPRDDEGPGGVFVSVKDDGAGFDAAAVREGHGMGRSIRGRIAEVGGRVEVDGRPGRGAEIRMWL
jgi:signal transduction histidine kinase